MEEKLMTIEDLMAFFCCGPDKIRKMVRENKLPTPIKRGRRNVWFESSVEKSFQLMKMAAEKNVKVSAFR